tara:strand:- start:2722 stop:3870 length:1149 start_codon:yes stop_codon:yes gene_type:complete
MAFLDNSGDIILDAVLTDTGRLRLSQGDGSFKITKFALGDDEINYSLYDKNHASGSAYYDLQILQTPILEAFTNNTSNLNTKLMSISRTNLLYMPTLKLAKFAKTKLADSNSPALPDLKQLAGSQMYLGRTADTDGANPSWTNTRYVVAVDADTFKYFTQNQSDVTMDAADGTVGEVIQGYTPASTGGTNGPYGQFILIHQGLDTNAINATAGLDGDLYESQYILEMDYRLGRLAPTNGHTEAAVNFIDDDNIASYYVTQDTYVRNNPSTATLDDSKSTQQGTGPGTDEGHGEQVFQGPRGSTLSFRLRASPELQYSTYLFTQIGQSEAADGSSSTFGFDVTGTKDTRLSGKTVYWLDTTVRIHGANTGARLDIPVRFVKIQ